MIGKDWVVGMKLVCIEAPSEGGYGDEQLPVLGQVYTIREILLDQSTELVCLLLNEVVNLRRRYTHVLTGEDVVTEPAFPAFRFRPVEARPTDISIFKKLLTGAKERERV